MSNLYTCKKLCLYMIFGFTIMNLKRTTKVTPAKTATTKKQYHILHIIVKGFGNSRQAKVRKVVIVKVVMVKVKVLAIESPELEWRSKEVMTRATAMRGPVSSLPGGTSRTHSPHPWLQPPS